MSARKGYRLVAVEPAGVNAFFLRHDVATHIPACDPARAYRLLEKFDVLMKKGEDVFGYASNTVSSWSKSSSRGFDGGDVRRMP